MFYPSTQNNSSAVENNSPIYLNHVKLTDKEVHAIYTYTHTTLTLTGKSSRDTGVCVCVCVARRCVGVQEFSDEPNEPVG